jgi:hypothetical protein
MIQYIPNYFSCNVIKNYAQGRYLRRLEFYPETCIIRKRSKHGLYLPWFLDNKSIFIKREQKPSVHSALVNCVSSSCAFLSAQNAETRLICFLFLPVRWNTLRQVQETRLHHSVLHNNIAVLCWGCRENLPRSEQNEKWQFLCHFGTRSPRLITTDCVQGKVA